MIKLDGNFYSVSQTLYAKNANKLGSTERGLTGKVLRNESQVFETVYGMTLLLNTADVATLRASFDKSYPNIPVDFIDEEGWQWLSGTGMDDDTHFYNTGVYFTLFQEPKPLSPVGWNSGNRFTSQIGLITDSYYGIRPRPSGYLITDVPEYIITDLGERLLWDASI
jgi:hypothetical protein